ncbi:MAG TPA: glycosyltransferase [Candidatus Anoxymicrobiaceae bacterium]
MQAEIKEQGISLILPVFNEENTIFEMVQETVSFLEDLGRDYEVIVVDDGSTDKTSSEMNRAIAQFGRVTVVTLQENVGKGNALRAGFYASTHELVCFLDADLDLHPSLLENLIGEVGSSGADIVIGSKRHPESRLNYPWFRKLYSTIYYLLILALFRLPVKDTQTGIKLFKREVLANTFPRLICKQYTLDLELLVIANRMGYTISEAPIELSFHQEYGSIRYSDIRNIIVDTMSIFYRVFFLKYYDSPLKPVIEHEPFVSIIVPTARVDDVTLECLQRCCQLNYAAFDIKLLPDEPYVGSLPSASIKVIPSGAVGPSVKRNMGARDSKAEVLAFIDSDAYPEADWLKNAAPYFEDPDLAAVCGPAVTPTSDSARQQASGLTYSSSLVSGSTTFRYTYHAMREVDDYPSCNLLVKRDCFEKAGEYPEEFWPGEDTVLSLRLTNDLGKKILYVPNVVVYHHRRSLFRGHLRQVYAYAKHRGYFVRKFPETSRRLQFFVPSLFLFWLIAGLVGSIFSPTFLLIYLSVVGLYLLLALLSCVKTLKPLLNLLVFLGIVVTTVTYGWGFARGLATRKMVN